MGKRALQNLETIKKELNTKKFSPQTSTSLIWNEWITNVTPTTCYICMLLNGKIINKNDSIIKKPPLHQNCKCEIEALTIILSGTATIKGTLGTDHWITAFSQLPNYYVTKKYALSMGWNPALGNLSDVLPNKQIGGIIFKNNQGLLPDKLGRIWREADINYISGYRNGHRLLYSNDGLIFVTYDHYKTFYEIK